MILTVLSFGLYNFYVQIRQIEDLNDIYAPNKQYSFFLTFLFSIITFGFYFCYHEYRMTLDLHQKVYGQTKPWQSLWVIIATFFGLWFLVDSYQQGLINSYYERKTQLDPRERNNIIAAIILLPIAAVLYTYFWMILGNLIFPAT